VRSLLAINMRTINCDVDVDMAALADAMAAKLYERYPCLRDSFLILMFFPVVVPAANPGVLCVSQVLRR